ncbi:hypothetical protein ABZ461_28715 [Actinacidiphila glaucinigra]|uniref:hypothetical protein n=1 Tax=Actinacidiphila glaucinigra TaxID=235986 RepID=UPI0033E841E7
MLAAALAPPLHVRFPPERGAKVAVFGRRKDKLDEVVAQIIASNGEALAVPGDVSISGDLKRHGAHRRPLRRPARRRQQRRTSGYFEPLHGLS